MGACGSTAADADERGGDHEGVVAGTDVSVKVKPSEKKQEDEFDFRETVKGVVLLLLERLAQALEYESDAYNEAARSLEKENFIELSGAQYFERLFQDLLEITDEQAEPEVEQGHVLYESQRLVNFLHVARRSPYKKPLPTRKELAQRVSSAARKTVEQLKVSANAVDSEELRAPLELFVRTFESLTAKDLDVSIYDNIDKLCANR